MKKTLICLQFLILFLPIQAQYVTLEDSIFSKYLQGRFPECFNGQNQLDTNCAKITTLKSFKIESLIFNLASVDGIQYMDVLEYLDLSNKSLVNNLPRLPKSLLGLDCSGNLLKELPPLHEGLKRLNFEGNRVAQLPPLPSTLVALNCAANNMVSMGDHLPKSLISLMCYGNLLKSLPPLPDSLTYIDCYENQIGELPPLPKTLLYLYISYNKIKCLPRLPESLELAILDTYDITCLPNKPALLEIKDSALNNTIIPICNQNNDKHGCVKDSVVTGNVGDQQPNQDLQTLIYPNPTKGQIKIKASGVLRIMNLQGQLCLERQLSASEEIDLNELEEGIYYYQIGQGKVYKLILQH